MSTERDIKEAIRAIANGGGGKTFFTAEVVKVTGDTCTVKSDGLTNGDELELPTVEDKRTVAQYRADSVFPATAITGEQYNETIEGEGVEFWGIEFDFIVS